MALYPGRRAPSAPLALGWYAFALSALLPLRGLGCRAREWALAGLWRRRGLKARTTAGRRARLGPPFALPLNYQ